MELVCLPSESVLHDQHVNLLGAWAPWLGVIVCNPAGMYITSTVAAAGAT